MTDEERQKFLCAELRKMFKKSFDDAADEIERLAKEKADLRSAAYNYAKDVERSLDKLKERLAGNTWWFE